MLIRSLRAENFMKFESLCLENLPTTGVIGIEGVNESGKSTIAEAVFFGLFGRSGAGGNRPVERLIRWGADQLRVEIEFVLGGDGGEELVASREIDRFGTNYAKVLSLPDRVEVASGHVEVEDFLRRKTLFDAAEFQQSFYFSQLDHARSLASSCPLSEFVESVTGIAHLSAACESIGREVEQLEREFSHYQKDIGRNLRQMERYAQNFSRLPELEENVEVVAKLHGNVKQEAAERGALLDARRRLAEEREARERRLFQLASARDGEASAGVGELLREYSHPEIPDEESRRYHEENEAHFRDIISGLAEVERFLADFRELCREFDEERERIAAELEGPQPGGLASRRREAEQSSDALAADARGRRFRVKVYGALGFVAAGAALFAAFWPWEGGRAPLVVALVGCALAVLGIVAVVVQGVRLAKLRRAERRAAATLTRLGDEIEAATRSSETLQQLAAAREKGRISDFFAAARSLSKHAAAARLREFEEKYSHLVGGKGGKSGHAKVLSALARKEKQAREKLQSRIQSESKTIRDLESRLKKSRSERDRLENEIRECRSQMTKREVIEEKNRELEQTADAIRRDIEDRRCASRLLDDTINTIRLKVGPALASLIRVVLPRITDGRYENVKVGERMDIRVFAQEKSDFLSFDELSGGTNEALMLALRLAFAQAFVTTRTRRPQFVLLDEPFRMLDVGRALAALAMLRKLSPDLLQFFIIQPFYTEEQRRIFDYLVRTSIDSSRLEVTFSSAPGS